MSEESIDPERTSDTNLLLGVVALQADYINNQQFVDACMLWGSRKDQSLADVLIAQNWLNPEERDELERIVQRKSRRSPSSGLPGSAAPSEATPAHPGQAFAGQGASSQGAAQGGAQGVAAQGAFPIPDSPQLVAGPLKPDNIELRRLHSTGGIGQVWLAHDQVLDREIALKELRAERVEDDSAKERFFREAQITAQLTHPGAVPVYEYRDEGGRSFYTMKFLQGRTLTEVLEEHHRQKRAGEAVSISLIELLNHFLSICNTIAYAHDRNIIHRDLKGDNVIVGNFGEVTVIDWGLAKRLDHQNSRFGETVVFDASSVAASAGATIQGQPLGTPAYMSPEQARGEIDSIDYRTDVYGLAAILYETLTGLPPFRARDLIQLIRAVEGDAPDPPSKHAPDLDPSLEAICLRGLSKDADDRQQTAAELRDEVQDWITDQAERRRTEQERERFFSLSPDLLLVFGADGMCRQVNPAVKQILGWTVEEFLARPIYKTTHPEDWPRTEAAIARVYAGEPVTEFEERDLCKDGNYKWIQWSANLIHGEDLVYAVGRDVTERKLSEQKFRGILESAPDAMVITDKEGVIQLINSQTEQMFGYDRDELIGTAIEQLIPERFRKRHPEHFAKFVDGGVPRPLDTGLKLLGLRRDGSEFPIEISLSPVETEAGLLVSSSIRDASLREPADSP